MRSINCLSIKTMRGTQLPSQLTEKVEHKLPTYDYRKTDYTYKSNSILGRLHEQYCKNLKLWTQLNSDRDEISNGGDGGQLDIHLMTYKAKYFATNKARYKTERNLRETLSSMYEEYIRQMDAIPKTTLRFKDFWYELIKRHYFKFKQTFPDENDRKIASVILYEQIRGRDYSRNPIRIHNAGKYAWHVCIDELCSIKAHMIDDGRQFVISKHRAPSFMKLFQKRLFKARRSNGGRNRRSKSSSVQKAKILI